MCFDAVLNYRKPPALSAAHLLAGGGGHSAGCLPPTFCCERDLRVGRSVRLFGAVWETWGLLLPGTCWPGWIEVWSRFGLARGPCECHLCLSAPRQAREGNASRQWELLLGQPFVVR